uniref:Uncharacterized protein n=1 Tax=Rhizophora mucronata TaxID=61149 RepID=A0A2P2JVW1_RHIMU
MKQKHSTNNTILDPQLELV